MSVSAMAWAFGVQGVTSTQKLVLLALADHANEHGECWPGLTKLGAKCCLTRRSAYRTLGELRDLGLVAVIQDGTRAGETNRYRLNLAWGQKVPRDGKTLGTKSPQPRDRKSPEVGTQSPKGRDCASPKPSMNHQGTVREPLEGARGARLPDGWQPSDADRAFALGLRLDAGRVADGFRDYWHAAAGANARKRDWSATWRNWCRREAERRPAAHARLEPPIRNPFTAMMLAEMRADDDAAPPRKPLELLQ